MDQKTQVEILSASLEWIKDKETNSETIQETGLVVDEILEWMELAKTRNLDVLNVLRDVFVVAATEANGNLKIELFELFVTAQQILESRKGTNGHN